MNDKGRSHLRRLAGTYAEYALSDVMTQRREKWRRHNGMRQRTVPLKLCGSTFDPDDFRAHPKETLDIGRGHFVEFVFRDTNRLTGAMEGRVAEACRIVRDVTGHPEGTKQAVRGV